MTLEKMQVIIEAQTKAFRDEMKKMQQQIDNATSHVNKRTSQIKAMFSKLGSIFAIGTLLRQMFTIGKNSATMARTVEGSIQQINRILGQNSNSFQEWVKNNARGYNMAKADALSYGATYGNLLSSFLGSTSEIEKGTTDLLKASSVISSATSRTMEDVMERIRSGLLGNTEAIEDLGINVNVALLQTTDAFRKLAGDRSWNELDFRTQQQIRLMAILEQTSKKYGDEVANNTNSKMMQLSATIKDISLNIGNALLPVLNVVIPVLQTIASRIEVVTAAFAKLMEALFGKSPISKSAQTDTTSLNGYANAMDNVSSSAKKMKGSLAGFDELNVLQNHDASGGGTAGSGGFGGSEQSVFEETDTGGIDKITEKVNQLKEFLSVNKPIILSLVAGIASGFIVFEGIKLAPGILTGIKSAIGLFTGWQLSIGQTIQVMLGMTPPVMGVIALVSAVVAAITYLWNTSDDFRKNVSLAVDNLMTLLTTFYEQFIKPILDGIAELCINLWNNGLKPLWDAWCDFVGGVIGVVLELWNALSPFFTWILEILGPIWQNTMTATFDIAERILTGFLREVSDVFGGLTTILNGITTFISGVFSGNWKKAWEGLKTIVVGVFQTLGGLIKGPINAVIGIVNGAISSINKIGFKIPDWVPIVGGKKFSVNVPKIQYLAEGGIASRATYGVFGEAGTEAVIPLKRNTQGIEMIANKLLENMPVNEGGGTYLIQLVLEDGTILAKKLIKNIKDYEIMTGKPAF